MDRNVINKLLHTQPTLNIGKNDVSGDIIREINQQLKKNKAIKVRFLKTVQNIENSIQQLDDLSNGKFVKKIGMTAIFIRKE